jgi:uncharacterized protein (DUF885 family)
MAGAYALGMRTPFIAAALAALFVALPAAFAQAESPSLAPANASQPLRSPDLLAILDEHVEFLHRENPLAASRRGDERYNHLLGDESPEAYARRRSELAVRLDRLRALDRGGFSEQDHVDADLLIYDLSRQLAGARFQREQMPISTMGGPQIGLPQMADQLPFRTPKHFADYAVRLEQVPRLINQHIQQMRAGLAAGRMPPRVTLVAAVAQARQHGTEQIQRDPASSSFYKPFLGATPSDEAAAAARRTIANQIVPAYRQLAEFLEREYIPAARASIAAADGIDGLDAYNHSLAGHTTLDLSAEQIHQIGLDEVARIRREMFETIARSDFDTADLQGDELFAAFVRDLRTNPRFYYTDAEALLDGYRAICKKVDPERPRLFATLPRNTYGVRALPDFVARSSPTAYYYPGSLHSGLPGYFMANTYRLDQRPKYGMIALTLHEAVPGHHFQYSLADEIEDQHEYRTWIVFTAFGEGWALYAERLGLEMGEEPAPRGRGLYADPYDDFGRLSFEVWRACRLVVDTGMHAKGWSRQQAIDFMLHNTALALHDITSEVDRYISWPGQATGYKIGELKIRELRARAEEMLGERFDLRAFHDAILTAGQLPLPVLEERIRRWVAGH